MITIAQQEQLEKYVTAFQTYAKEGSDSRQLQNLIPEFYHFVGGCKKQVEKALEDSQNLNEGEVKVAEGLLNNLTMLHNSLLETAKQLGIRLDTHTHAVTADHRTQEIRVNFEQCHQDSLKNIVIQAISDALDVEAPLANSSYTIAIEPDHTILIRVVHAEQKS